MRASTPQKQPFRLQDDLDAPALPADGDLFVEVGVEYGSFRFLGYPK